MDKIFQITQVIDEDTGEVKQNYTLEVQHQQPAGINQFVSDFKKFGDEETQKAIAAGVDPKHIKKHQSHPKK